MKFDEVAILLACHTFQDFPVHLAGADADGLLAAWTALWHPLLIANSRKMPTWLRVDTLPSSDVARLVVLPPCHENVAADGLSEQVTSAGGRLIRGLTDRQEILAAARADWATEDAVDDELAAEFMALGYAYLQIELLTKRMRYSTRVLETAFADNLVSATAKFDRMVEDNSADLRSFTRDGLPELERLLRDSRNAAVEVQGLARSLRDDPSQLIYQPPARGTEIPR